MVPETSESQGGKWTVPAGGGARLIDFLSGRMDLSRGKIKALIDRRCVFVNRRRVWIASYGLSAGDCVEVSSGAGDARRAAAPASAPVKILWEGGRILVAAKPAGIESNGRGGLEQRLRDQTGEPGLRAVHRLDRDTTGALILVRDGEIYERMVELFRARQVEKRYRVIAQGLVTRTQRIDRPLDGQPAVTRIVRVIRAGRLASYLEVSMETGRTHQIRRHLAWAGHPVAGDTRYQPGTVEADLLRRVPRQMLHAFHVGFPHPETGAPVSVTCPPADDFEAWLKRLGLAG